MKHVLLASLLLALTASAVAQQKEAPACTVRIALINQNWHDHAQTRELMSPDQMKWWLEDGQKKFKNFCFVPVSKPHDYRIVWTDTETTFAGYAPSTTTTTGEASVGNKTVTYSETSVSDTGKKVEYKTWWVQVQLFKSEADAAPLFNELHKGKWIWSKPDRQALENALKALSKLTKRKP